MTVFLAISSDVIVSLQEKSFALGFAVEAVATFVRGDRWIARVRARPL